MKKNETLKSAMRYCRTTMWGFLIISACYLLAALVVNARGGHADCRLAVTLALLSALALWVMYKLLARRVQQNKKGNEQ